LGEWVVLHLATEVSIPVLALHCSIADIVSVTLGIEGGHSLPISWIDLIRLEFARAAAAIPLQEGLTSAGNDTRTSHFSASHHASCDYLAAVGAAECRTLAYPFPVITADTCLMFRFQHPLVDISTAVDTAYDA
jgi:hypothetical protein